MLRGRGYYYDSNITRIGRRLAETVPLYGDISLWRLFLFNYGDSSLWRLFLFTGTLLFLWLTHRTGLKEMGVMVAILCVKVRKGL